MDLRKKARLRRKKSIRKRLVGTEQRPRLCVFRSAKHIYAQVVDDSGGYTLAAASTMEKEVREHSGFNNKVEVANFIGQLVAKRAMEKGIKRVL